MYAITRWAPANIPFAPSIGPLDKAPEDPHDAFDGALKQLTALNETATGILSKIRTEPARFSNAISSLVGGILCVGTGSGHMLTGSMLFVAGGLAVKEMFSKSPECEAQKERYEAQIEGTRNVLNTLAATTQREIRRCRISLETTAELMDQIRQLVKKDQEMAKQIGEEGLKLRQDAELYLGLAEVGQSSQKEKWEALWRKREESASMLSEGIEKFEESIKANVEISSVTQSFHNFVEISQGLLLLIATMQQEHAQDNVLLEEIEEGEKKVAQWQAKAIECFLHSIQNYEKLQSDRMESDRQKGIALQDAEKEVAKSLDATVRAKRSEDWRKVALARYEMLNKKRQSLGCESSFASIQNTIGTVSLFYLSSLSPVALAFPCLVKFIEQNKRSVLWFVHSLPWFSPEQKSSTVCYQSPRFKIEFDRYSSGFVRSFRAEPSQTCGVTTFSFDNLICPLRFDLRCNTYELSPLFPEDLMVFSNTLMQLLKDNRLTKPEVMQILYELFRLEVRGARLAGPDVALALFPLKIYMEDMEESSVQHEMALIPSTEPIDWTMDKDVLQVKIGAKTMFLSPNWQAPSRQFFSTSQVISLFSSFSAAIRLSQVERKHVDHFLEVNGFILKEHYEPWTYLLNGAESPVDCLGVETEEAVGMEVEAVKTGEVFEKNGVTWQIRFGETRDFWKKWVILPLADAMNQLATKIGAPQIPLNRESQSEGFFIVKVGENKSEVFCFDLSLDDPISVTQLDLMVKYLKEANISKETIIAIRNWLFCKIVVRRPLLQDRSNEIFFEYLLTDKLLSLNIEYKKD